jgi:hypothetical protein
LFIIGEAREARPRIFALPYFVKGSELRNDQAIVRRGLSIEINSSSLNRFQSLGRS